MSRLVVVATFFDQTEAVVAAALLDSQGFAVFRQDKAYSEVSWFHLVALGGIRLMVPVEEAAAARALLAIRDDPMTDGGIETCPHCGSANVMRRRSLIMALIGFFWAAIPILLTTRRRWCRRCRHDWRIDGGWRIG